jgi:YYY domain-containing protein
MRQWLWRAFTMLMVLCLAWWIGKDLAWVGIWWGELLALGLLFLPVTQYFFACFFDRGYLFSKVLGILIPAFLVWFASSLHCLPFSRWSLGLFILLPVLLWTRGRWKRFLLPDLWKTHWRTFLEEELFFLLLLLGWIALRGSRPDIHGLEKFMDFGFVNTLLQTSYMPPADLWMAGKSINYYYFGHFVCAFLTRLTAIDSAWTYNLMIATLASLSGGLVFSLTANALFLLKRFSLKKSLIAGVIAALLLTFGANLHPFLYSQLFPKVQKLIDSSASIKGYWFSDATRYIGYNPPTHDKTIHEFPAYSFVAADLHGHVSDIPIVLTLLALVLQQAFAGSRPGRLIKFSFRLYQLPSESALLALLLAIAYMTNTWDFPIYFVIAQTALFFSLWKQGQVLSKALIETLIRGLQVAILCLILTLPFLLSFMNFSRGIGWVHSHSPLYQLGVLWGYQAIFVSLLGITLFREWRTGAVVDIAQEQGKAARWLRRIDDADLYICVLSVSALGLILMPEIIYVKDIYAADHYRANTMFKSGFQAFILLSIVVGYTVPRVLLKKYSSRLAAWSEQALLMLLVLPLIYPYFSFRQMYPLSFPLRYCGLDGLQYLKSSNPGDYQAILWLKRNAFPGTVVLEANGDSYTDYARISANTGFPTVLGWYVHESLWRGDQELSSRVSDIDTVYESGNYTKTCAILNKYGIKYVVIGILERQKFKNLHEETVLQAGEEVFRSTTTKIIRVQMEVRLKR